MDVLAKIIAKILVDLLQYVQAREDLKTTVRNEMEILGLKDANEAIGWKAAALSSGDGGATLLVRGDSVQISLPGRSPDAGSSSGASGLQPGAEPKDVPPAPGG